MLRILFGIPLILLTITGNLLVIISIAFVKTLRRPNNFFILSVAVADFTVGVFVLPLQIVVAEILDELDSKHPLCYAWISGDLLCCNASVFGLTVISLDRYMAIAHPLVYRAKVTTKRAIVVICIIWIGSFIVAMLHWVLPINHPELSSQANRFSVCIDPQDPWYQIISTVCSFFLPLSIILFVYGKISSVLAEQTTKNVIRERDQQGHVARTTNNSASQEIQERQQSISVRISEAVLEKKGCIMMRVVVGVFIFCWLPIFSMWLLVAISRAMGKSVTIPTWVYDGFVSLSYFNSCLNPLIYTMFSQEFRFAFTEIICLRGCSLNSNIRTLMYSKQIGKPVPPRF